MSPAPRLVILANYGAPYSGTFISMIRATVSEVNERGWRAEVVLSASAQGQPWLAELDRDDIAYRFAPDASTIKLRRWLVNSVLTEAGPTVLHTHFTMFDVPAVLASLGRTDVSVYWHIHSNASSNIGVRIRNVLKYSLVGRFVERIFCVAPDIAEAVGRRGGSAKRVIFVPNAIDTDRFPLTLAPDRSKARQQLDVPSSGHLLLHFGWDWQRKGGDLFVETLGALINDGVVVLGITVGGGERARATVAAQGLPDKIRVLEPVNNVGMLYAAADVLLTPSIAEGMPFSIAEALCTGLAVVGSNIPGQAVIAQNIGACRLTALNKDALVSEVRRTISRTAVEIATEGESARAQILSRFDLKVWARRIVDFYAEAGIARRPR